MENNIVYQNIWSGRTKHFDEIADTFGCTGVAMKVDKKKWTIEVDKKRYDECYGMLMDLNSLLGAGW